MSADDKADPAREAINMMLSSVDSFLTLVNDDAYKRTPVGFCAAADGADGETLVFCAYRVGSKHNEFIQSMLAGIIEKFEAEMKSEGGETFVTEAMPFRDADDSDTRH